MKSTTLTVTISFFLRYQDKKKRSMACKSVSFFMLKLYFRNLKQVLTKSFIFYLFLLNTEYRDYWNCKIIHLGSLSSLLGNHTPNNPLTKVMQYLLLL